ncbi:beta strand repeat-containing protein [Azospirillum rugosum]|uniref:Ca2+-binding RTX toxin-like protein n=1 Tax=Azospirillum rugosum TaxID=416170 RepID=A0ABS4ST29_9PROT|nr:FG-GAP-like repeat-containing protein [Azospirillum rugosum]MBP2295727.1 Ca2+-binding RTX toxin-like protein [Azospirillum rugosum]MDQ0529162.1 Ca2+-binding RTX toxin-like protein [Azospirillum rugosum]
MTDPNYTLAGTNPFGLGGVPNYAAPVLVDIDGDGDLDALIGIGVGNTILYRNVGTTTSPSFSMIGTNSFGLGDVGWNASPAVVDIDGDGDLDLVIGNSHGSPRFYRNDGTATSPSFTEVSSYPFGFANAGTYVAPTFVDIDGDGDFDVASGNSAGDILIYRNVGTTTAPSFTLVGTNPYGLGNVGSNSNPTFVDIDGDGDRDALIGNRDGNTLFYRNVGSATSPSFTLAGTNPFGLGSASAFAVPRFADIDGDGKLEALIGGKDGRTLVYSNALPTPTVPTGLALTDGSNSGSTADTLTNVATPTITGTAAALATVVLYDGATAVGTATADGSGKWTITAASLSDGSHALTAKASDANGTSTASTALMVSIDKAAPTLVSAVLNGTLLTLTYSETLDGAAPAASAFAVTVDGAARTVGTVAVGGKTVTLALDGGASSIYNTVLVGYTPPGSGARTADVAGNAAGALNGQRAKVAGDPNFVLEATNPFGLGNAGGFEAPTFVDIDGDGDLDMIAGNSGGSSVFYRNVGTATAPSFTLAGTNPFGLGNAGGYTKPTFEDIDGDGDLDALIGNSAGNTVFYRNVGTATQPSFTLAGTNPFGLGNAGSFVSPAFADLDGDGDLDALIGNLVGNTVFYRNVGTATAPSFTAGGTNVFGLTLPMTYAAPTFVDIDGDGDLDVVIGGKFNSFAVYRNVGTTAAPSFTLVGTNPFGLTGAPTFVAPSLVDIDGDGDLDLLAGFQAGNTVLYRNAPPNTAPVLDAGKAPALASEPATNTNNPIGAVGTLVSDLVGLGSGIANVTDPDGGAVTGIAITGTDSSHGILWYTTNGGTTWGTVNGGTTVTGMTSLLLKADANTRLYFQVTDSAFAGTIASAFTFRAWDQTSGTAGSKVNTTNGGTTAFSAATDTASITVTPVGPRVTDARISISGGTGIGGAYKIGDTVTATWDNSYDGDNNTDPISGVTIDFSQFGGGTAVTASSDANGVWTAKHVVAAGGIDATNRNVSVSATSGSTTTTADSSNATVDTIAPRLTLGNMAGQGTATGTGSTLRIGDTVTAVWDNSLSGDNNSDTISGVTADFSQFGGGTAVAMTNAGGVWRQTYVITAGSIDAANRNVAITVTDNAGNSATLTDTANHKVDNVAPTVTDANVSISGATGTGGAYKIGDTVTATWNNTGSGDNNADSIASVTVNFSQFGGGTAVTATNNSGTWTATYVITAGSIDATNRNVSIKATDNAGNSTTTADSTNATVDNVAPLLTLGNVAGQGTATGTGNTLRIGDTVTAVWDNSASGDNNPDTISGVTADFSQFGGGTAVAMTNSGGVWRQTYVITAGSIDAANRNVAITVTDDAGNSATITDTANHKVDNVAPTVTAGAIGISGGTGPGGVYKTGDTVTATWDNSVGGDNNTDSIGGVTVDFSQFGGGTAVAATSNGSGVWTAKYVVAAGGIDAANRNVSVKATDNAGNATTTAGTGNAAVDNVAPTLTDASIAASGGAGGAVKAGDTVTVTWNSGVGGDNNSDAISAVTVDFSQFGGGTAVAATNAGGVWTATYTIAAGTALGSNRNVSVTATDDAGNSRTTADTSNLTIANTAPVLDAGKSPTLAPGLSTSTGVPGGAVGTLVSDLVGLGGGIGNVTDIDGGAVTGIAITATDTAHGTWWYSTDGGANWAAVGAVSDGSALLLKADANTRLYLQLPDSTFTGTIASALTFRAWDQTSGTAGNKVNTATNGGTTAFSAATDTASISITPGAPVGVPTLAAASDSGVSASDRLTNATAITLTGSGVAANSTVRLYTGTTLVATAAADGTGTYQFTDADVSGLTGATSFTVRQVAAGIESADSAPVTITFDRDRPTLSITTLSGDDRLNGTEAGSALLITGTSTAEVGQTVTVGLNGQTYTGTVVTGGGWSVTVDAAALGGLGNQPYTVTADLADAAGNAATQATRTLTVDKVTPEVAITSAALSNRAAPVLAGTAKANSAVTVIVAGATYATGADGNGGWSVDLATATPTAGSLGLNRNGANAVSVTARDAAGNSSAPATQTLVLDTTAPTATVRFEDDSIDALEQRNGSFVITDGEAGVTYAWTLTSSGGGQVTGSGQLGAGTTRVGGLDLSGLGDGTLTVTLSLTDPAGNSAAPLSATTRKLTATVDKPAPIAPLAAQTVDGATVNGAVTVGADGGRTTTVSIAAPAAGRQEDASTPNADLADVPVVREQVVDAQTGTVSTVTTLTVSVSTGVAATAAGSAERHTAADSAAGLIGAIEARTGAGSASRTGLTSGGTGFLAALSGQAQLLVRAIDFSTPNGAAGPAVQTRVTGAGLGGTGQASATPTAVVLNTSGVAAPMTIQLDDVQFAAVIGDATLVGGEGEQVVYGDAGRQWLYLGAGDDALHGGAGDDTVASAGGNDTLFGDDGNDVVMGGEGDDWALGGAGDDLIGGGTGNDRGFGGTGNDILFGEAGDDTLTGEAGNDTVVGGAGNDLLFGEEGADFLVGEAGNDTLNAGAGNDTALGGDGSDLIGLGDGYDLASGEAGNDTVLGEAGNDTLFGGLGDDLLSGGAGDDLLFADGGADTLWGGAGRDVFALGRSSGGTVVADFRAGEDRLAFTDPGIDLGAVIRSARVEGGNTTLDIGNGGRITIVGQTGVVAGWFG